MSLWYSTTATLECASITSHRRCLPARQQQQQQQQWCIGGYARFSEELLCSQTAFRRRGAINAAIRTGVYGCCSCEQWAVMSRMTTGW
jgi:hypothetical protein